MPAMTLDLSPKNLVFGFIAAALAVIVFHQGMILLLHLAGFLPNFPWSMKPTPNGIPTLLNLMFWGGVWGVIYAAIMPLVPISATWLRGLAFGIAGPWLLGNALLVPFFKKLPYFFNMDPQRMVLAALINGCFGIGVALIYAALKKRA
jgi:hypothetical protein